MWSKSLTFRFRVGSFCTFIPAFFCLRRSALFITHTFLQERTIREGENPIAEHNCEKKVEKKEWLERTVVEFTVQQVLTDENIEKISTRAMELIEKELQDTSILIGLQERLKETNKRIKNLMSAMEQGIITPTTKERLEELEEERRDLEGQIAREEMKKPLLTKERIMYWLESFKRGDIEDVEYQRRIIDTLVNSVYVYDDGDKGRKLVLTFNISRNNTLTISSSDIERTAPPYCANPNSIFFVKHCFGFVFVLEGADPSASSFFGVSGIAWRSCPSLMFAF